MKTAINKKVIYMVLSILLISASLYVLYTKYNKRVQANERNEVIMGIHKKIQKDWIGKSIFFPDSLYQIQNPSLSLSQHLRENDRDYILVSYLNADCSDCILELKNWNSFLNNDILKEKVEVFFIAKSSNKANLSYQVIDQANFQDEVFFDVKGNFKEINDLPETKAYQTFLINKSKIVYVGSPAYGDKYVNDISNILLGENK